MRSVLRFLATRVSAEFYERLLAHAVLKEDFAKELDQVHTFKEREDLWCHVLQQTTGKITYVEFGVYAGYSIKFFADRNKNSDSTFIGLDCFEGLPEDWGLMKKVSFDVNGKIPSVDDSRVKFVKGLFQHTWTDLVSILPDRGDLIVHYDADLYSSTLFSLTKIDSLRRSYVAIFDEFSGHEARALHYYQQAYSPKIQFIGKTVANRYPVQVVCNIDPL